MAVASSPAPPDLRTVLDEEVVAPLFRKLRDPVSRDESVPEIVLQHRRRRAQSRLVDALVSRGSAHVPTDLRREVERLVRQWKDASFSDAFQAMEKFEIRCAEEHDLVVARESGDPERLLAALERQYRGQVKEAFGSLELRGIQTTHRVWQRLEEVYVPLHLEDVLGEITVDDEVAALIDKRRIPIRRVLEEHRHILIVGAPGSGKSTFVAYLATRAATGQLAEDFGWGKGVLPFVLTVRALKTSSLSPQFIAEHSHCDLELVTHALAQQNAILLVDGLDEAAEEERTRLIKALHSFIQGYPEIRVVATSRPAGAPGEIEKRLHGLQPFRLADFTRQEVDEFIDKWCLAAEQSVRKDLSEARKEAERAAKDLKARLSQSYAVERIAVNPLLVTILCVVHRFLGRTIPEHRVTLYEKCTDALLYEWDRAKFEEGAAIGSLDAPSKRRLLMGLARKVHEDHVAEIPEKEVLRHFSEVLPDLGRSKEDAKRIIAEIRDRSGLLVERRPGFFAFSHLTFQEYLCALDYARTKDFDELSEHYKEPWWHEVIVLAAGSPGAGGGIIPRKLLAKKEAAAVLLAAQCLYTEADMPLRVREKIERELGKLMPPRSLEESQELSQSGIIAAPILARFLEGQEPEVTFWVLRTLYWINYAPVLPEIARCIIDQREIPDYKMTVSLYTALILAHQAIKSDLAKATLRDAVEGLPADHAKDLLSAVREVSLGEPRAYSILESVLKEGVRRISSPKRVKSTA
jgi:NACHT domain